MKISVMGSFLIVLSACSCPDGFLRDNDGNCIQATTAGSGDDSDSSAQEVCTVVVDSVGSTCHCTVNVSIIDAGLIETLVSVEEDQTKKVEILAGDFTASIADTNCGNLRFEADDYRDAPCPVGGTSTIDLVCDG